MTSKLVVAASWLALSIPAFADTFDYEVGLSYDAARNSASTTISLGALPPIPAQTVTIDTDADSDSVRVSGSWYFDGASAAKGPRSRAAFISRASSLSLSYEHNTTDLTTTISSSDPLVPTDTGSFDTNLDTVAANLRWVWPGNGWYGLASFARADVEVSDSSFSSSNSVNLFGVGIGKYIGPETAIDVTVLRAESGSSGIFNAPFSGSTSTSTEAIISLTHIGDLGPTWQYGTDVSVDSTRTGSSEGSFDVALSLYPNKDLAFGLRIGAALQDLADNATNYEFFASWFTRDRIQLSASYGFTDINSPTGFDVDQYNFGLGANIRF